MAFIKPTAETSVHDPMEKTLCGTLFAFSQPFSSNFLSHACEILLLLLCYPQSEKIICRLVCTKPVRREVMYRAVMAVSESTESIPVVVVTPEVSTTTEFSLISSIPVTLVRSVCASSTS